MRPPADLVPVPAALLSRLARLGVDVDHVLRKATLARSRFEPKRALVTTSELFAFWRAVEEVGGVTDVGLQLGAAALPHEYSVAYIAALHAETFGEALARLGRYKRLTCPEELELDVTGGEARLQFKWLLADGAAPELLVDGAFAGVVEMARRGAGRPVVPIRVELARPPRNEATLTRFYGASIRFGARADVLVFAAQSLDLPFVTHNAELQDLLVPGLEAALAQDARGRSLTDDVRGVLRRILRGGRPALDRVGRELGMSGRTLQRRLEETGTSYQHLLDEVRRESARHMLADTDLDAGEVAFLLGFQELNSFTRAFQGWEGTTPSRWRAEARGKTSH